MVRVGKSKKTVAKTGITVILAAEFEITRETLSPETKTVISDRWTTAGFQ